MGLATFFFWCLEMTSLGYLVCENVVADVSWGISLHLSLMMMTWGSYPLFLVVELSEIGWVNFYLLGV